MHRVILYGAVAILLAGCANLKGGQVETLYGRTSLEHDSGAHSDEVGVRYVTRPTDYGVQGVLGLSLSEGENQFGPFRLDEQRVRLDLGARLGRDLGILRAYLGIGLEPQLLAVDTSAGEHDTALALPAYGALGLQARLGRAFLLGLEFRATAGANFDLVDERGVDMDDRTLALTLGWRL